MVRTDPAQVLERLAAGESNPEISRAVGLRPATVAGYRRKFVKSGDLGPEFASSSGNRANGDGTGAPGRNPFPPVTPVIEEDFDPDQDDDGLEQLEQLDDVDDVLELGTGAESSSVSQAKDATAVEILEVRRLRAEVERAKLEKQLRELNAPPAPELPAPTPGTDPVLAMMMAQMADARQTNSLLMGHLLKLSAPAAPPAGGGMLDQAKGLAELIEVVDQLRGDGGGGAPTDPAGALMSLAMEALKGKNTAEARAVQPPAIAPGGPAPVAASRPPGPTPFDPEAENRGRATAWFDNVQHAMDTGADPRAIAEHFYGDTGLLPADLRTAIVTETPMGELMPVAAKYVDRPKLEALAKRVSNSARDLEFLGLLLGQLRRIEADEQAADRHQPVGAEANGRE